MEQAVSEGRSGRPPWLRPWLVVALAGWAEVGVELVDRANRQGLVEDIAFSPYHLVGYAALLTLGVYVIWAFSRALRHGDWRHAFPPLYGGLGLGFALLVTWIILDTAWRSTLGINPGIESGLSPPRLLIPVALALIAAGPLREAIRLRAQRGLAPGELIGRWAGVAAAGLIGGTLTLVAFNPVREPLNDWTVNTGADETEIWTMAADGTDQTRVLPAIGDGVDYSLPVWSPDGKRIAYTTWTNKGGVAQNLRNEDQTAAIWTMAADGTDRRLVVDGAAEDAQAWIAAWSPDGKWIAYSRGLNHPPTAAPDVQPNPEPGQLGQPSAAHGSSIWIVPAEGGTPQRLTSDAVDAIVGSWSPDGSKFALVVGTGGTSDVHVASINVGAPGSAATTAPQLSSEVALAADPASDGGPSWSPDGSLIAFTSDRSGNDEIYVVQAEQPSATPVSITQYEGSNWVPAYSPDGKRIAFVSDRSGESEVWSMAADGTDPRNLTNHPRHWDGQWSVNWSPDGNRLAYATASFPDAASSGWVREDFAAAESVLFAIALAIVALLIVALGAPFGAFTLVTAIMLVLAALPADQWRLIPAGVLAGFLVDLLVRSVRHRRRAHVAAAALPGLVNLAVGLTIGSAGTLAWSVTLLLGVGVASALIGWGLAELVARLLPHAPDVAPTAAASET